MVFQGKFLKKSVVRDYDPAADGPYTVELTDQALHAIWVTVKGDLVAADQCIDDYLLSLTSLDVLMGSRSMVHYVHPIKALLMNCKLKQHWPYLVNSSQTVGHVAGVSFPILFGAPYLNPAMSLPASKSNRKYLTLGLDIATDVLTDLLIDVSQVIQLEGSPAGAIKQDEYTIPSKGIGEWDHWLQTNWDLLKLMLYSPTVPTLTAYTSTIEWATLEVDDMPYGYDGIPWEHLHAEVMDELEGSGPVEDHYHLYDTVTHTSFPFDLERWIAHYGEMDFFFEKDLKWRAPLAGASMAKLKYYAGVDEAWGLVTACYVPAAKL